MPGWIVELNGHAPSMFCCSQGVLHQRRVVIKSALGIKEQRRGTWNGKRKVSVSMHELLLVLSVDVRCGKASLRCLQRGRVAQIGGAKHIPIGDRSLVHDYVNRVYGQLLFCGGQLLPRSNGRLWQSTEHVNCLIMQFICGNAELQKRPGTQSSALRFANGSGNNLVCLGFLVARVKRERAAFRNECVRRLCKFEVFFQLLENVGVDGSHLIQNAEKLVVDVDIFLKIGRVCWGRGRSFILIDCLRRSLGFRNCSARDRTCCIQCLLQY